MPCAPTSVQFWSTTIVASVNKPNLRVTILGLHYSPEPSGNAPYTTSLAEGLARKGYAVTVVTGYPHYPEWRRAEGYDGWSQASVLNGVQVKRLRHYIPRVPTFVNRLHMELSFGIRVILTGWGRPDVVLCVSPALFSTGLAAIRCRLLHRRSSLVMWVQDLYSRGVVETGPSSNTSSRLAKRLEAGILGRADAVVAIHDRFRKYLMEGLALTPEKVHVVRNWTHLPPTPDFDKEAVRKSLKWGPDDIIVLHAGNMGKKQGLENVVNAARLAGEHDSQVRFVLMGDGNQRDMLEKLADGVSNLSFVAPLPGDEFQKAMGAADVLLVNELPGVTDMSVPSKLTSYFDSGVPVIAATDAASVTAQELAAAEGGLRVDAADPLALLQASEMLGTNPDLASKLGAAGQRFRRDVLSEQVALDHYDEFIQSLASPRGL
ncbi:glycosyltransferase family 4 protein [Arthrobacter sp. SAFR-179]|uniref:glycosyltransferase family 4 protein n=1 Tax=Arthrobacter sp. SAFR-179 TaxID=3387279 RepID=UPI003F7BCCD7